MSKAAEINLTSFSAPTSDSRCRRARATVRRYVPLQDGDAGPGVSECETTTRRQLTRSSAAESQGHREPRREPVKPLGSGRRYSCRSDIKFRGGDVQRQDHREPRSAG